MAPCPFGLGGDEDVCTGIHYIEHLLDDPKSGVTALAGMILGVVQGRRRDTRTNEWLRQVRRITRARAIPLIIDEVQAGVGRTGRMYALGQFLDNVCWLRRQP